MRFDEIERVIRETTSDDWHVTSTWGWGGGPSYLDRVSVSELREGGELVRQEIDVREHVARASWRGDVSLGLAWGFEVAEDRDLSAPWAEGRFADPSVSGVFVDVLWNGMLVRREQLAIVDGARAYLPWPLPGDTRRRDDGEFIVDTWVVTPFEHDVARLVDSFTNHEFERYFERAGLQVRG